jgi:hypothetical protein
MVKIVLLILLGQGLNLLYNPSSFNGIIITALYSVNVMLNLNCIPDYFVRIILQCLCTSSEWVYFIKYSKGDYLVI